MYNPKFIYFSHLSAGGEWAGQAGSEQRTSVVRIKTHSTPSIAGCTFTKLLITYMHLGVRKPAVTPKQKHSEVRADKFCNNETGAF